MDFLDLEAGMDKELNIVTGGIQMGKDTYHFHRYEPTPYEVLKELFDQVPLNTSDVLVDFGCGKGRLNFYLHHRFHCHTVGIEFNPEYYEIAVSNLRSYHSTNKSQISFECVSAMHYEIKPEENYFYFFNPFSPQIFMGIINHILQSVEQHPRAITLLLYYPDDEYLFYLEHSTPFHIVMNIPVYAIKTSDERDRFIVLTYKF